MAEFFQLRVMTPSKANQFSGLKGNIKKYVTE